MKNTYQKTWMIFLSIIVSSTLYAQSPNPKDLAGYIDPNIKMGQLPNGVKYIIWKNDFEKGKCDFHTFYTAGALTEAPGEYGLGHIMEHIAHDPTPEADTLLKHLYGTGLKLGPDINAGTNWNRMSLFVKNVSDLRDGLADTIFAYLSVFPTRMEFLPQRIEMQRKTILAEGLQNGYPALFNKELSPFVGEKYARLSPLGDSAVVKHFSAGQLKAFYDKWYGLNNLTILAIGDFDPIKIEQKIQRYFGGGKPTTSTPARFTDQLPELKAPGVLVGKWNAPINRLEVTYKLPNKPQEPKAQLKDEFLNRIIAYIINKRLKNSARSTPSPFSKAGLDYGSDFFNAYSYDTYSFEAETTGDLLIALKALQTEIERIVKYGFNPEELAEAKNNIRWWKDGDVFKDNKFALPNSEFWIQLNYYLLDGRIPFARQAYWDFEKQQLPQITLEEVNKTVKGNLMQSKPIIRLFYGKGYTGALPSVEDATKALNTIKPESIGKYTAPAAPKSLFEKSPQPGTIVAKKTNESLGCVEWVLSNGAKVVFKKTDFVGDVVLSFRRNIPDKHIDTKSKKMLNCSPDIPSYIGVAGVDKAALGGYFSEKTKVSPSIYLDNQYIFGNAPSGNIEEILQLINLYFTSANLDAESLQKAQKARDIGSGMFILMDSLRAISRGYNLGANVADLAGDIRNTYLSVFDDPRNFTLYIVGKAEESKLEELVNKYIASLSPKAGSAAAKANAADTDNNPAWAQGRKSREVHIAAVTPSAAWVYVGCQGKYDGPDKEAYKFLISKMLIARCNEVLRGKMQAVYTVYNIPFMPSLPDYLQFGVHFMAQATNVEKAKTAALEQLKDVLEGNISESQFDLMKKALIEQRKKDLMLNGWWVTTLNSYYSDGKSIAPDYIKQAEAITLDDVKRVMKDIYSQGNIIDAVFTQPK